jgi:cell division protein ZapA (FtsZ GTPase activity inhibitor)
MKQKYTITVADVVINVVTDESPEAVESLVGLVDRKMREIAGPAGNCPKSEAAILCALDYCSERIKSQRKVKALETKLAFAETALEEAEAENEELRKELEELKMMIAK